MGRLIKRYPTHTEVVCDHCDKQTEPCDLAWCYELLLKRLAAYEDTGLEPSEIKELVTDIEKMLRFPRFVGAISSPPNEPLTLEELREMDGKPVWVKSINDDALFAPTGWAIVTVLDNGDIELDFFGRRDAWVLSEYSEDADEEDEEDEIEAIYRRKPEEGKMDNETN